MFNFKHYIKEYFFPFIIFGSLTVLVYLQAAQKPQVEVLKDYKDGIQNHLVWSIKGECYFVRPSTDPTVNLIRVVDCDRK
jgi:hypothetical protein